MSRKAIITVGTNFGDEAKGATVDYLCQHYNPDFVIRYSGGCQAGHTVILADGKRHTFSQWGAGTFRGIKTYLDRNVVISPSAMVKENQKLIASGINNAWELLSVHPRCLVATPYHQAVNRIKAIYDCHGSCGMGISTARSYWLDFGDGAIFAEDLRHEEVLREKCHLLAHRCRRFIESFLDVNATKELDFILNGNPNDVVNRLYLQSSSLKVQQEPKYKFAVFEGSQGVLLDEVFGFHPHTTWGHVDVKHALESLKKGDEYTILGVTRLYMTRHGNGPFPTCIKSNVIDDANPENAWQGKMRFGWLDMNLLRYSNHYCPVDAFAVNCCDAFTSGKVCFEYDNYRLTPHERPSLDKQQTLSHELERVEPIYDHYDTPKILDAIDSIAPVIIQAYGRTAEDRTQSAELKFRRVE